MTNGMATVTALQGEPFADVQWSSWAIEPLVGTALNGLVLIRYASAGRAI